MIFDSTLSYAWALAHNGTVSEVDLQVSDAGEGTPICIHFSGTGMTGTGITLDFQTGTAEGGPYTSRQVVKLTAAEFNAGGKFDVPVGNSVGRYSTLVLTNATAGTWTAGVVFDHQSNT